MKLWVLSDLHLETSQWDVPTGVEADVVVLAGDIHTDVHGLNWASAAFAGRQVVYVAGNHEGYGGYWLPLMRRLQKHARPPLHFLERASAVIQGVRFLGTTLWTDCNLWGDRFAVFDAKRYMNDFYRIRMDQETCLLLDPMEMVRWHDRSLDWLDRNLAQAFDGPTVVVTHHAPHANSVRQYDPGLCDPVSGFYASDLAWLIERHQPALWIHGHSHASVDYQLGRTRVLSNPAGYERFDRPRENRNFKPDLVVKV